jgi:hypothetical protein
LADVVAGIQDPAGSLANEMLRKHLESERLDGFLMARSKEAFLSVRISLRSDLLPQVMHNF